MPSLAGLQVLRGAAALLVVVAHAISEASSRGFSQTEVEFAFGNFGVDLFFVISGFIIVYSTVPSFGKPGAQANFILRRAARIAPLYWIISTLYLFAITCFAENPGFSMRYIVSSYLFFPWATPNDNPYFPFFFPGWTLEYEMFFYISFSVALTWRRSTALLVMSVFMISTVVIGNLGQLSPPFGFLTSSQLLEFVAGCLLAEAYLRSLRLSGPTCLAMGVAATTVALVTSYAMGAWPDYRGLVWGVPALTLVGAVTLRPVGSAYAVERALARLGDVSYSLYLVHVLVFVGVANGIKAVFRHWNLMPPSAYVLTLTVLSVGAAFLCFHLVERPLTRKLQLLIAKGLSGLRSPGTVAVLGSEARSRS